MKRLFSCLLIMYILFSAFVQAESIGGTVIEPKPEITIDRVYKTLRMNGEESLTHGWIAADVTITNYSLHTLSVKDDLSGTLVYDGLYEFFAEPVFAISEFEPLVRLSGSMIFKVPKLILEAESSKIMAALELDGESIPLAMDFQEKTKTVSAANSFDAPEDLLVYFIDCLKNADFESAIHAFAHEEKAEHFDFDWYVKTDRMLSPTMSSFYPDFEAYKPLAEIGYLPTSQINTMVLSLLAEFDVNRNVLMQYRNGMLKGMDIWTDEQITIDEYKERMNPARFESLSLEKIYRAPVEPTGRAYISTIRRSLVYGYSDIREYVLLVSFEGKQYLFGITLSLYPEGWKIWSLSGNEFNQVVNAPTGGFIRADEADELDLSEMILTWKNGNAIEENLLKDPAYVKEDLIGTWTFDEGTITFGEEYGTVIAYADENNEMGFVYCISDDYLYMFEENGDLLQEYQISVKDGWLTMTYDEGESVTFRREN